MAVLTVLALALSCLGWGLAILRLAGPAAGLTRPERLAWGFGLGLGASGWVMFPLCLLLGAGPPAAAIAAGMGLALAALFRRDLAGTVPEAPRDTLTWALFAVLGAVIAMDLANALVPPVDADSIAYHFALPKRYLAEGVIGFVPQAVEAAIPLLLHMTYLQALALGGESGLTLWCALSAWSLPLAAFALARRHLPPVWALALLLVVKTMPAVVYGSPSGQVEVRLAALFLPAVVLAVRARRTASPRLALAAGLAAGFCAGAKYSGLLAPAICGLALLGGPRRVPAAAAFGLAGLAAGGQWYAWNWAHTGDPLFPMLWGRLPYAEAARWDESMTDAFRGYLASEVAVPKNLVWLFWYPVKATFDGLPIFESGRTGLGPLAFILLPLALIGARGRRHDRPWRHDLVVASIVCLAGYALWFLAGSSQRVRHFLPEYVPLLIALTVATHRACRRHPGLLRPVAAGIAAVLAVQLAGQAVFSLPAVRHLWSRENAQAYLVHTVSAYPAVQWLNAHLGAQDRVLLTNRELVYHLAVPATYLSPSYDGRLRLTPPLPTDSVWIGQLRMLKITHLLVGNLPAAAATPQVNRTSTLETLAARLIAAGCAVEVARIVTPPLLQSRTLRLTATVEPEAHLVVALELDGCEGTTRRHGYSNLPARRL